MPNDMVTGVTDMAPQAPGERIRALRTARGWSRNKLAALAEISQGNLSDIENGKVKSPSGAIIGRLADTLGTSADYLLGLIDDPAPADRQRKLTPAEQLAEMGLGTVFARGGDITEADVEFFRAYLETQRRLREKGKGGPKGK